MKRKVMSVSEEVDMLDEQDKGLGIAAVRQHCSAKQKKLKNFLSRKIKTESGEVFGKASA
jgi:hypothetical protein